MKDKLPHVAKKRKPSRYLLISDNASSSYTDLLDEIYDLKLVKQFSEFIKDYENNKDTIENYNLILFTGGEDISPKYYNENIGSHTKTNPERDVIEFKIVKLAKMAGVRCLGICRGAQLLTVAAGGKLIQHVEGHTKSHLISSQIESYIADFKMTSTHHQMMYPFNLKRNDWSLLAWSKFFNSTTYLNGENKEVELPFKFLEPEIVYYSSYRFLCIQGHPEHKTLSKETKKYIIKVIRKYLY